INGASVFAMLLGIGSLLCLFQEAILLVIPLVGVVVAIVALRHIAHSNGTQTGKGLAITGLILSLSFGGFAVARMATERARTSRDRAAIDQLIRQLSDDVKSGNFDAAYALF